MRYPVWRLERDPSYRVVIAAYNQTFAKKLSRKARRIARGRITLSRERNTAEQWETDQGGGIRACGVGSPPTGEGADLIVIDDPIKKREEADSETYREKVWEWYTEELLTRLEPGGAVILILTRWHHDDLAGRILAGPDAANWSTVSLPALAEPDDPLGRQPGEALCPDRYPVPALERIQLELGDAFDPLYQQRATRKEGNLFRLEWFATRAQAIPAGSVFVRYWDKAYTTDAGCYTAGVLMAKDPRGRYYVVDVARARLSGHERESFIRSTALLDAQSWGHVVIRVEQEPAGIGRELAENTIRALAGFEATADPARGDKVIRAGPLASQAAVGNVILCEGPWNAAYVKELIEFPMGQYKDQVDASSGAFAYLAPVPVGVPLITTGGQQQAAPGVFGTGDARRMPRT